MLWLRAAIAVLVLAWLIVSFGGGERLLQELSRLGPGAILLALAVFTLDRLLMSWKWIRLLRSRGESIPLLAATRIYCASMVWGMFLPATVGADAVRAVCADREGVRLREAIASILVERAVGVVASLALGAFGLLVFARRAEVSIELERALVITVLLGATAALAVGISLGEGARSQLERWIYRPFAGRAIVGKLERLHRSYAEYRSHPRELAIFFALSLLEQVVPALAVLVVARALGAELPALLGIGAVAIAYGVARIPISLGGIGVLEAALVGLLALAGTTPERALAIAIATRLLEILSWLPWWLTQVLVSGTVAPPPGRSSA